MDLGADGFQTVRHVILPQLGSALLAGALLAFALSFDEVIVTTFTAGQQTTLPIWMLQELIRPRQRPVTNVVAVIVIALTFIPILVAYWLTRSRRGAFTLNLSRRTTMAAKTAVAKYATELLIDGTFVRGEGDERAGAEPGHRRAARRRARGVARAGAQGGVGGAPRVRRLERNHADGALAPAAEAGRRDRGARRRVRPAREPELRQAVMRAHSATRFRPSPTASATSRARRAASAARSPTNIWPATPA